MEEPRSNGNGKAKAKSIVVRADDRRQSALERLAGAGANGERQWHLHIFFEAEVAACASWYMIWGLFMGRTKPERKFYPVGADGTAQYEVDMGKCADSTLGKVTCQVRLSSPACVCG